MHENSCSSKANSSSQSRNRRRESKIVNNELDSKLKRARDSYVYGQPLQLSLSSSQLSLNNASKQDIISSNNNQIQIQEYLDLSKPQSNRQSQSLSKG